MDTDKRSGQPAPGDPSELCKCGGPQGRISSMETTTTQSPASSLTQISHAEAAAAFPAAISAWSAAEQGAVESFWRDGDGALGADSAEGEPWVWDAEAGDWEPL